MLERMLEARFRRHSAIAAAALLALLGCQKTYYTMLEQVGVEKRELLTKRIGRAKESQQEAQQEFRDALEKFQALTGHGRGDLEDRYDRLRTAYERSEDQAREVSDRIDAVESVANALIEEWKDELERYQERSLRRRSEARLRETESEVDHLLRAMHRAERSLEPVLEKLEDRVLYVKHNLNAAALAGLQEDVPGIERDVDRLVREMQASIAEADRFIAQND
jgi:DNA repair exonuclease SbcCD ATPase subunit